MQHGSQEWPKEASKSAQKSINNWPSFELALGKSPGPQKVSKRDNKIQNPSNIGSKSLYFLLGSFVSIIINLNVIIKIDISIIIGINMNITKNIINEE